jgi:uracil-DNA glycosylase family 4
MELAELIRAVREHLRWEMALGSHGLPQLDGRALALPPDPPAERPVAAPAAAIAEPPPSVEPPPPVLLPAQGGDRRARLAVLQEQVRGCTLCRLCEGRTHTVFARGNPDASLMFVGEGPGYNEDQQGKPFVGPAGQLLDKMIAAMGFGEGEVYICNVVKCRPPDNRTPNPDEAAACMPYLRQQIGIVAPKTIVALGRCAAETLGVVQAGGWRGVWGTFENIPVMPTYHPAYLLRSPEQKRPVWQDLQAVVTSMGRTPPASRR